MPIVLNGTTGITTPTYNGSTTAEYLVPVTGFKNRIINGRMQISQRGTSFTGISTDGPYTIDRFQYAMNGGGAVSSSQSSTSPAGFSNSLLTTVTTADGTVASSSYYQVRQVIEGFNIADLNWGTANSKTVTVSFWVNCSVVGTYTFTLRNTAGAVSYVTTYSIPAANTWTYITITVPGPTIGTWGSTNDIGIFATWDFGTGSTSVTSSTNTWIVGNFTGATGATKLINTNGATFYLTGVQFEVGSTATSFDYRPYGTELQLCQRYYEQIDISASGSGDKPFGVGGAYPASVSTIQSQQAVFFKVPKRVAPTTTFSAASGFAHHCPGVFRNPLTSISLNNGTVTSLQLTCVSGVGGGSASSGQSAILETSSAGGTTSIGISAELS